MAHNLKRVDRQMQNQLETIRDRVQRIIDGQPWEGDREPGRVFADLEYTLSCIGGEFVTPAIRSEVLNGPNF